MRSEKKPGRTHHDVQGRTKRKQEEQKENKKNVLGTTTPASFD
jgi:hypothetical protein